MQLSDYLAKHGITHAAFAERLGVSQGTVTRYVNGDRIPRPEHLVRIKDLTRGKVTVSDFVAKRRERQGE